MGTRVDLDSRCNVKFVYFDLGNVLLSFDPEAACANLARRWSIEIPEARSAVYDSGLQDRFEHGEVNGEQFAAAIRRQLRKTELDMPTAEVLDAVSDMFTPVDSMSGVLHAVRADGFGVGLLSNTCHAHWDWIQRQRYAVMDFEFSLTPLITVMSMLNTSTVVWGALLPGGLPEPSAAQPVE